jgi:hypothetical protein
MSNRASLIRPAQIEQVILLIRGQRVMLDRDLAVLYGVETKNLNKAVQFSAILNASRSISCFNSRWTRPRHAPLQGSNLEP